MGGPSLLCNAHLGQNLFCAQSWNTRYHCRPYIFGNPSVFRYDIPVRRMLSFEPLEIVHLIPVVCLGVHFLGSLGRNNYQLRTDWDSALQHTYATGKGAKCMALQSSMMGWLVHRR
jgi:hypothetical protein